MQGTVASEYAKLLLDLLRGSSMLPCFNIAVADAETAFNLPTVPSLPGSSSPSATAGAATVTRPTRRYIMHRHVTPATWGYGRCPPGRAPRASSDRAPAVGPAGVDGSSSSASSRRYARVGRKTQMFGESSPAGPWIRLSGRRWNSWRRRNGSGPQPVMPASYMALIVRHRFADHVHRRGHSR